MQYQKGELSREEATDKILHCALKSRRRLFKHNDDDIQTNKVLDLIANTTPTVAQQAQTPAIAQQADMHNLRTTAERKPTQRFTPSTYNQQKTKKRTRVGVKKEEDAKLCKQKGKKKKKKFKLCHH